MNYFIQTFNPIKWFDAGYLPEQFDETLQDFNNNQEVILSWSMQAHRLAKKGDISFFLVQGVDRRGIYGAGIIDDEAYPQSNWNGNGRQIYYVDVKVIKLTHYTTPIISLEQLEIIDPSYNWSPRSGGITLPFDTGKKIMQKLNLSI